MCNLKLNQNDLEGIRLYSQTDLQNTITKIGKKIGEKIIARIPTFGLGFPRFSLKFLRLLKNLYLRFILNRVRTITQRV